MSGTILSSMGLNAGQTLFPPQPVKSSRQLISRPLAFNMTRLCLRPLSTHFTWKTAHIPSRTTVTRWRYLSRQGMAINWAVGRCFTNTSLNNFTSTGVPAMNKALNIWWMEKLTQLSFIWFTGTLICTRILRPLWRSRMAWPWLVSFLKSATSVKSWRQFAISYRASNTKTTSTEWSPVLIRDLWSQAPRTTGPTVARWPRLLVLKASRGSCWKKPLQFQGNKWSCFEPYMAFPSGRRLGRILLIIIARWCHWMVELFVRLSLWIKTYTGNAFENQVILQLVADNY